MIEILRTLVSAVLLLCYLPFIFVGLFLGLFDPQDKS